MTDYIIAIPSYKRAELIKTHTLKVLEEYNINPIKIFIFVANDEEQIQYLNSLDEKYHTNIIVGVIGLKNQRNFISDYYEENTNIVQFDDDIKNIYELSSFNIKNKKDNDIKKIGNLDKFIIEAFNKAKITKSYLWGVYPVNNSFFMTTKMTKSLKFIVGPMFGVVNRHSEDLKLTIDEKEDTERTIQYYLKDKSVLRFNNITIETAYYKNKGGLQAENKDRKKEAFTSANYLTEKYPSITKLYLGKKSGHPEVKLLIKKS